MPVLSMGTRRCKVCGESLVTTRLAGSWSGGDHPGGTVSKQRPQQIPGHRRERPPPLLWGDRAQDSSQVQRRSPPPSSAHPWRGATGSLAEGFKDVFTRHSSQHWLKLQETGMNTHVRREGCYPPIPVHRDK